MCLQTPFKKISLLLLLFTSIFAQSDIIINEIMYDPISGQPEWVEIYNRSSNTYDLANWKLSDALNARTITTKSISIGPGEFVVLTQDSSIVNFFNISSTIIPLNSWSGLNNGVDEVVLIDNTSQTIDSLKYTSSWGDADKSIERIYVNASSTDRNNWAVTLNPNNGTPGFTNSATPKENDVAVSEIAIVQNPPIEGENLSANVEAKNHGTKTASSFSLSLYNDTNFNSIAEPGELISSKTVTNLASGDSSTQVFSIGNFSAGNIQLIGVANLSGDQLSANDTLITSFTILPQPPPFNAIVINELMYAPPTGQPEWVEIFNRSNITYDLANWQFSDGTSTSAITTNSISIAPDEYIIITEDSSIVDFYNTSCKIIVMNLPSLNNSGDRAVLMNEYSIPVDSFTYSSSWGGSNNKSLERIDVDSPSTSQANWGSSVNPNNATPGRINSLSPKNYDLTVSNISISPDPAFEDIDIAAVVEITNLGEQTASSFSVNLYNDLNFDDTPQSNELISSFSLQNLASGNSMEQLFGLGMLQQGTLKLIGVVNFGNDEDNSNDTLISEFTINPPPPPFNSIVINETMYAPSTGQPEWVELYNNSNTTFNLADWKFADGSTESIITSEQITIAPSEYLVLSKDASIQNYFNINAEVIVMNLPSLNNSGDRAILMDSYSIPIDSLTYSSSWGGTNGKSLERIDFNTSSNDPLNWGTSQSNNNATPGYINSLSQKNFDLAISRINISPSPAIENTNLSADIKVMNYGLNTASSFTVSLYNDQNFNSIADPNELINSFVKNNLASLDSVIQNFDLGSFSAGSVQLIATIDYANDEAPANNKFIHEFTVYPPPPPFNSVVINEIMYSPFTDQPEWVELYNNSNVTYDLANWKFADGTGESVITIDQISIAPGEYLILTKDASIESYFNYNATTIVMDLPNLNNSGDRAILMDNFSIPIDSLTYSSSWGGTNGRSLERISFDEASNDPQNWGTSISTNNATPGDINSLSPKNFDLGVTSISILPLPPIEGTDLNANLKIINFGSETADSYSINLYNDLNFNSVADPNELINSISKTNLVSGDSLIQNFDLGSFSVGSIQLIGTITFLNDENPVNNSLIQEFSVISTPSPFNAIVINEIMYDPPTGHPEWIEIYNRSNSSINLANWKFADGSTESIITSEQITIAPSEYLILSKDASIQNYFNINAEVIVMNLPSLNNSGDRAILMDNYSFPIDSLAYSSSWGGTNGRSLERISVNEASDDPQNWGTSISTNNATPGSINSISPKDFDLGINAINISPTPAVANQELTSIISISNFGTEVADNFTISLYHDENYNAIGEINELIGSVTKTNLASGDSHVQNFVLGSFSAGSIQLIAKVDYNNDENNSNNIFIYEFIVNPPPPPFNSIVINEIMYSPFTGQPEWVELYNNSNVTYDLVNWRFADGTSESVITNSQITIAPREYLILTKDASIENYFDYNSTTIVMDLPNLNNSGDRTMLMDNFSIPIDSLTYSSSWGGQNGKSLERINVNLPSNNQQNWGTSQSIKNATPGIVNSITPKIYDLLINKINITPFPAIEESSLSAEVLVINNGTETADIFSIDLFHDKNFNSIAEADELIESVSKTNLSGGDTLAQKFNIGAFAAGSVQLIANVSFSDDEDTTNNTFNYEFVVHPPPPPFNSIVINEIMYAPSSGQPEWVELYNNSNTTFNLTDWKFADGSTESIITSEQITIAPSEYLVLSKGASIQNYFNINTEVIVMNLPSLNNSGDRAILMDNYSIPIDSLTYSSSWGGTNGKSLERIDFNTSSNDPLNWGTSQSNYNATPGYINSLSQKNFDLAISRIKISPSPAIENTSLSADIKIMNYGLNTASSFTVSLYNDQNFNSIVDPNELINSFAKKNLASLDSVIQNFELGSFSAGSVQLIATIDYANDEAPANNKFIHEFTVYPTPPDFNAIVINEIMYSPPTGQPEWIEIYNRSNSNLNLANWKLADNSTTSTITVDNIDIAPAEYVVISNDSSILNYYNISAKLIVANLPVLNDGGDRTILMDGNSIVVDSLTYSNSWGGKNGRSLERIDFNGSSNNPINWGTSVSTSNATPGDINSISPKENDLGITAIAILPSPPVSDQELTAQVSVKNFGSQSAVNFTIRLYNDKNNNSIGEANELIGSANKSNLASNDSVSHNFSIGSFSPGSVQLIANVIYNNDENTSNNNLVYEFSVVAPPPPFNAIVINEIMYAPASGQPEWIEICNRSNTTYNLIDWKVSDAATTSNIITESLSIDPGEFIILSKNESINDIYSIDAKVIVMNLPSLNNSGDKIVLMDDNLLPVDSLTYSSSWGGQNGKSLERINVNLPSIDQQNWGTSQSTQNATPGLINSITPKNYDLQVNEISITPIPIIEDSSLSAEVLVTNNGTETADIFSIDLFHDRNFNSIAEADEFLESVSKTNLLVGQSLTQKFTIGSFPAGSVQLIATVNFSNDEDTTNNKYIYEFTVFASPPSFNDIVINEIMYAPDQDEPEWIEIYNRSTNKYNLTDWTLSDRSTTATITFSDIEIEPNEYIVLSKDSSLVSFYSIESKVIVMNLPVLNNSGDNLYLINNNSFTIDSLEYSSNWGGSNGNSLERIDAFAPSTSVENWSESISPNGATPGYQNSVIPREFDLTMISFNSTSTFLFVNEENILNAVMRNNGAGSVTNAAMDIYLDSNGDSLFTSNELYTSFESLSLASGETYSQNVTFTFSTEGVVNFLAITRLSSDQYSENDSLFLSEEVINPVVTRGEIVINEFMYAPTSPYPEWIELFNKADIPQQFRSFSIADSRDTVIISTQNILLPENSYLIIARDSIMTELYNIPDGIPVVVKEFPSLNNSGDKVMLLDNYSRVIDSLEYTSEWGGDGGRTLERINPFGNSSDSNNWVTSSDPSNGTPGKINSIAPKEYDVAVNEFYSIPSQPVAGETVNFFAELENKGVNTSTFSLELYESDADSSLISSLESLQIENLSPDEKRIISFAYKIDAFNGDKFFLTKVNFPQDLDTTNSTKLLLVAASIPPLTLVINEIMYDPDDDEPEWIELYNRSTSSVNLKDWSISDVITNPEYEKISTQDVFVEPGEYVVLSKDSGIFNYHPNLKDGVILVSFANLNNTVDGVVIYDRLNVVIDSVFYSDNFPSKSGYSIERLSSESGSNDPANWSVSISNEKGTPGFANSIIPKDYDLVLDDIFVQPEFPNLGDQITISMYITNNGTKDASNYTISFDADFGVQEEISGQSLAPGTKNILTVSSYFQMPQSFTATAEINYSLDENISNNNLTRTFYSGYSESSVLINEVMYDPNANGTEWVEFINASSNDINLKGWQVAEESTFESPRTFTDESIILKPGEYFVIADDTSGNKFADINTKIFEFNFGELNSSQDIVAIFDFRGALIDSLNYVSSWGGGDGFSLERISLQTPTNLRSNWLSSIIQNGSTPGAANSTINISPSERKQIVINEIMFEPESGNSEFVELFNTSDQFVEIANWSIEDESKNNTVLSKTTFAIAPNSYFVIAADSSILINYPELKEFDQLLIANENMSLNNSDDLLMLFNSFDEIIDSVFYSSGWHNSRLLSTKNKSLERINPFLNGNDRNNWSTSVAPTGATPGKANSIHLENQSSGKSIAVTPNPFSPDGDGYEDFTIINYKLPKAVSSIQIKVFDSKGRKVRSINENNLFSNEGSIIFDGYNDDGQPLKIGIYILLIEAIDNSSGSTDTFKEVVVVARKL